jgi:allose kinase
MSEQHSAHDGVYIGVDVGGTRTRIGLFASLQSPTFTLLARFPTMQSYRQQMDAIISTLRELSPIASLGVSLAGRIARDGRSIILAPNLLDYIDQPFAFELEQALSLHSPARLAHDTVCGLLGEKQFGSLLPDDRCAYLTVSTGTGAAFHLSKAGHSLTVSIDAGHQILDGNPRVCLCGQVGCLETFTGGRQLELRLGYPVMHISDPAFWETFTDKLALGVLNLAQLTKAEAIAVGGAIILNNAFLLPLLQQKVDNLFKWGHLSLKYATLAEDAPLVGAALLPAIPEDTIVH